MSFIADKQTLEDLNLLGRYRPNSIFGLFHQTKTRGGGRLMEGMFLEPLTDPVRINQRWKIFQYFQDKKLTFPFTPEAIGAMENYMSIGARSHLFLTTAGVLQKKLLSVFVRDEGYDQLFSGLLATIKTLHGLREFIRVMGEEDSPYRKKVRLLEEFFGDQRMDWLTAVVEQLSGMAGMARLSVLQVARYDHLLKHVLRNEMEMVLERHL